MNSPHEPPYLHIDITGIKIRNSIPNKTTVYPCTRDAWEVEIMVFAILLYINPGHSVLLEILNQMWCMFHSLIDS